ncbi:MAG: TolC family protein [Prevotella sp.]
MRKIVLIILLLPIVAQGQTLEECQQAAERNYPLIRQYGLIEKTTELTVANIQKSWLPQVSASAQATYQNRVTAFPEQMQNLYHQVGITMEGLKKDQYRVGIDIQQTVYDGGAIKNRKEITRKEGELQTAQNDVNIYNVRKRVNEMYFGLLLIEEQIKLNADLQNLLNVNEEKLASMFKSGTAAESDYQNVKAERLNVMQQMVGLQAQRTTFVRMLSEFCGIEIKEAVKPVSPIQECVTPNRRPELEVINAQLRLADAQEKALNAALMPKLGVFAQGFYGYPSYNMFDDMISRKFSWNGMIGVRLSWNIDALYTHKNDKAKIHLQREMAEVNRAKFLFDNNLEQIQQKENIGRYGKQLAGDAEIIALRSSIRKAAESKLTHGIIDVNDLVKEINNENAAYVQKTIHEIEMLKEIYDLKFTINQQ